jgi:hypothetical protein
LPSSFFSIDGEEPSLLLPRLNFPAVLTFAVLPFAVLPFAFSTASGAFRFGPLSLRFGVFATPPFPNSAFVRLDNHRISAQPTRNPSKMYNICKFGIPFSIRLFSSCMPHVPSALNLAVEVPIFARVLDKAADNIVLQVSIGVSYLRA